MHITALFMYKCGQFLDRFLVLFPECNHVLVQAYLKRKVRYVGFVLSDPVACFFYCELATMSPVFGLSPDHTHSLKPTDDTQLISHSASYSNPTYKKTIHTHTHKTSMYTMQRGYLHCCPALFPFTQNTFLKLSKCRCQPWKFKSIWLYIAIISLKLYIHHIQHTFCCSMNLKIIQIEKC